MGLVTPWLAALGMTLSSLTVTLNALRLTRMSPLSDGIGRDDVQLREVRA